jgi:hypothetical protein
MCRNPHPYAAVALSVAALFVAILDSHPALADSYTVTTVAYTQNESFAGIDTAGDFVINLTDTLSSMHPTCGGVSVSPFSKCYETYYVGQASPVYSTTLPDLTFDNGTSCKTSSGASGDCNGAYEIFGSTSGSTPEVIAGPDSSLSLLEGGSFDGGFINSSGDAVFINGVDNTLVFADDTTPQSPIPEPASWLLIVTGGIILLGALRNKINRKYTL